MRTQQSWGSTFGRGLLAGAVGTTVLNAVTYLDMALTGRPASRAPRDAAEHATKALGVTADDNRLEAYGAVGGIAVGLSVGVVEAVARRADMRLPAPLGALVTGGLAMAATDYGLTALGATDPRSWTSADLVRDAGAHLAYGAGTRWALDRIEDPTGSAGSEGSGAGATRSRARSGLHARSLALGIAAGGRSTLGLLAPVKALASPAAGVTGALLVGGELAADKLPQTPSRLVAPVLLSRMGTGAVGAITLARRDDRSWLLPAVLGAGGAWAGSVLGAAYRQLAQDRGWTWQAGLVEDAVALSLAGWAIW